MKIKKNGKVVKASSRIFAAAGDEEFAETTDNFNDTNYELCNTKENNIDEDDIEEDSIEIELDNNIADHYIAECDICSGIFISELTETNQEAENITGICPICGKESEQYLKWIVKEV